MAVNEQTITLNGLPVRLWRGGEGHEQTLLLLHGGVGGADLCWEPVLKSLAESYHVVAPDLPGFGGTAALPVMRTQSLLAWVDDLLTALSVEQVVIVGNSLGALLARLYAAAHTDRTQAVILVNGGSLPNVPPAMRRLAQQPVLGRSTFYVLARSALSSAELGRALSVHEVLTDRFQTQARAGTGAFAGLMCAFAADDLPEKRVPDVPTLLLWGAGDEVNTLQEAERIKTAIAKASLVPVAGCGLLPQHEAPDVFVWQVGRFLQNLDRPSRPDLPGVGLLQG